MRQTRLVWALASSLSLVTVLGDASSIKQLELGELPTRAEVIALGKVLSVTQEGNRDHVTIRIASLLKGTTEQKTLTLTLVTRGGLKDFDPVLRKGDTGVFFLRQIKGSSVQKAYWGSYATFRSAIFVVSEK